MQEILAVLANVSVLVFVVSSMLAMGLSLTVKQIADPLRNLRLVPLMPPGRRVGQAPGGFGPRGRCSGSGCCRR